MARIGTLTNTILIHVDDDDSEGHRVLNRAVNLVKRAKITEIYGWYVGEVCALKSSEYFDDRSVLGLNYNRGMTIYIRLRYPGSSALLPFKTILKTLIHELVHCSIGPHNDAFRSLEGEITKLLFPNGGRKLGGGWRANSRERDRRRRLFAAAAEKRMKK